MDGKPAIMLARIKLDLSSICQAILELDDHKLSLDELKSLGKQAPTSEEVSLKDTWHKRPVVT